LFIFVQQSTVASSYYFPFVINMPVEVRKPTLLESIALGGASCIFTVNFTHPIETVKTRMQVTGDGLGVIVRNTLRNEGVASFWKGIVWAWGREGSYASIKLGGYAPVRDAIGAGGADGKKTVE
jgi:hypothetical protein